MCNIREGRWLYDQDTMGGGRTFERPAAMSQIGHVLIKQRHKNGKKQCLRSYLDVEMNSVENQFLIQTR